MKLNGASVQDLVSELLARASATGHDELLVPTATLAAFGSTYGLDVAKMAAAVKKPAPPAPPI